MDDKLAVSRRTLIKGMGAAAAGLPAATALAAPVQARRDQRLWYRQPANAWVEALPVGNGRIGAMVFGGTAQERLQLNEDTFWAGGPYNPVNPEARTALPEVRRLVFEGRYAEAAAIVDKKLIARPPTQMPYQPIGDLLLDMPSLIGRAPIDYRRELDLDSACAATQFSIDGVTYRREVVASPVHQVIAVRLTADRPGALDCDISVKTPNTATLEVQGDTLVLAGRNRGAEGIDGALRFETRVRALAQGGRTLPQEGGVAVRGADSLTILVAMATNYRRFNDLGGDPAAAARGAITAASKLSYAEIAAQTAAEHRRLFRPVVLDLGRTAASDLPTDERIRTSEGANDPALAALYFDYARYLLIASSRPGSQPANLQGIWNDSIHPPWGSKYTININTEMNYWPAEPCGLAECTAPLIALVRDLAETGARTAREMYGARGWVCHHNTDLWRATAPIDGAPWGMWPTGGAWLCTHLWERYDYGRDKAYLASVYPLMRGAALFFLDTLQLDPRSGYMVTNPSISPENGHPQGAAICAGPAMDMQILRDLLDQTVAAAVILDTDRELAAQMKAARARLAPDRIGGHGQLQEWQEDWDAAAPEQQHRHVSHLYAVYPSHQINLDQTPELAAAVRRSLEIRGDRATGWATAWRINLWARLRDGDRAHAILKMLLGPGLTYPNMFDAHPPFQIDGNFGGASAIAEMLMQSRGDEIMLLPALPSAWPSGSVRGLRARGACKLDIVWRGGKLESATIVGALGGERVIRCGERRVSVKLTGGRPVRLFGEMLARKRE